MQNRGKKHLALLVCLCLIFVSFFSFIYIAVEADHNCTEEGCSICACIHSAKQTIKQLGLGAMSSFIIVPMFVLALAALFLMLSVLPYSTPVSQKVRMNH